MKNKFKSLLTILFFFILLFTNVSSNEQFNFDITEIEITDKGNKYRGLKRGTITTDDGIIMEADEFEYNKSLNILNAKGDVKIFDEINLYEIYTDKVIYIKNDEKIFTDGNSKAINDGVIITANKFNFNKKTNIIKALENVKIDDKDQEILIFSENIKYEKNKEIIFSKDITKAIVENNYHFKSSDVVFNRHKMELSSDNLSEILDNNSNLFKVSVFKYFKNDYLLKAKNVNVTTNYKSEKSDNYFFSDGFFDLKKNDFKASKTKILMHNDIFGNEDNNPRLSGVSSYKKGNITRINKGIFTSCKIDDNCPPWSINAQKITHDKGKKQLIYDNAFLKLYDLPIVYFPKFFHPDPTVERQSGLLKPSLNNSQILGSSLSIPYFHVVSKDKDFTLTTNIFDNHIFMLQNEYRKKTEFSSFIGDFGFTKGYKSSLSNRKKNIIHFFSKYNLDLNLSNFITSDLNINVQKVTNDTYLSIFDTNLQETAIKPTNQSKLSSSINLSLDHENYTFGAGATVTENLSGKNSDRYQFVMPYYDFSKNIFSEINFGSLSFNSSGSNNLKDTNNLRSRIVNDLNFSSFDHISNLGIKNNYGVYLKNLNTVAKNDTIYKSSPQSQIMGIFEASSSFPLIKFGDKYDSYLTPKISFRLNPSDMKDHSDGSQKVSASGIFGINRLGLTDTYEAGKSLTVGLDYKKENIENINKYFELKLATVFRDSLENKIPSISSLNQKSSNLFGSIKNQINENYSINYDFSLDNNYNTFEYNSIGGSLDFDNFQTQIRFIEENGKRGDANSLESSFQYTFDESNYFTFNTRRNRKINLTEYYKLIYEYKNDCLVAGIKYNKKYYQDRDIKPTEDLLFSITIFPLTTYEKKFDRN